MNDSKMFTLSQTWSMQLSMFAGFVHSFLYCTISKTQTHTHAWEVNSRLNKVQDCRRFKIETACLFQEVSDPDLLCAACTHKHTHTHTHKGF
jgi:hypothetical protein